MPSLLSGALAPQFQAVLASAWISKRSAAKYVKEYVERVQAEAKREAGSREAITFAPPIQVQVLGVGAGARHEALDAVDGGEDSLFHARVKQNLVYGVADGVGGWNESGIDPSVFSRSLTAYAAAAAEGTFLLHDSDEADPKDIMRRAYAAMRRDRIPAFGSATALVMSLSLASGRLRTAQLGDSTYVVLDARQRAKFASAEQQHGFNTPYQLTILPDPGYEQQQQRQQQSDDDATPEGEGARYFRPTAETTAGSEAARAEIDRDDFADLVRARLDTPGDAREATHALAHNDLVVAATDGLFDNVRVDEVEKLADRFMQAIGKVQHATPAKGTAASSSSSSMPATVADLFGGLAYAVAAQAVGNYIQRDLRSPFAERAKLAGYSFTGGKPDDVTVMLAWVREAAKAEAETKAAAEQRAKL
ncbi:Protein phosphatase 2C 7 [Coemansia javaensis]|uniref:Protein phosphatase n=1 Tax=Coemansia javaensis TaxID=2761396 RepID=A0A9W8HC60_9FUNG|nr:Protein phosphatase 2C 7 [Coemansia javaensis]